MCYILVSIAYQKTGVVVVVVVVADRCSPV